MSGGERHPSCRRRLFADEDDDDGKEEGDLQPGASDNLANFLQEELRKARDAAKERWNFDFEHERPLQGRWQWEAVEGGGVYVEPPPDDGQDLPKQDKAPPPQPN